MSRVTVVIGCGIVGHYAFSEIPDQFLEVPSSSVLFLKKLTLYIYIFFFFLHKSQVKYSSCFNYFFVRSLIIKFVLHMY